MENFEGCATFENQAAQGDCLITRVDSIPANAVRVDAVNGEHVVAHSETGHNHVVAEENVEFYNVPVGDTDVDAANDGKFSELVSYLRVKKPTALRHLRSFDTHAPIVIKEGDYRINRQREYTPEGFRRAAD